MKLTVITLLALTVIITACTSVKNPQGTTTAYVPAPWTTNVATALPTIGTLAAPVTGGLSLTLSNLLAAVIPLVAAGAAAIGTHVIHTKTNATDTPTKVGP